MFDEERAERLEKLAEMAKISLHVTPEGDRRLEDWVEFPESVEWIRESLESGNEWAWCCVEVRAKILAGKLSSSSYLGACSYESEEHFRKSAYFDDMREEALGILLDEIETLEDWIEKNL